MTFAIAVLIDAIVNTIYYRAYPSTFVNLVWVGIAIYTIVKYRIAKPASG